MNEQRHHHIASPTMINSFICATFGALTVMSAVGLDKDGMLAMGIIRLMLGIIFFLGALINIFKGIPNGNLNLISAVCFGLFAGVHISISALDGVWGVEWQPLIFCIVQFFGGLYILLLLPALLDSSLYAWFGQMTGALGLMCQASYGMTMLPLFRYLYGFFFFLYTLLNIYSGLSAVIPELKQGPDARVVIQRYFGKKKKVEE